MQELLNYIEILESQSFEGWSEDEIKGYNTALISLKNHLINVSW